MAVLCTQDNIGNRMKAIVWSKHNCPYCDQAKALLTQRNIAYEERKIGDGYTREDLLESVPNARTVPQIFINNQLVGGFTELKTYLEQTAGGFGKGQI
jgi:glutaredoxin 3